MGLSYNGDLLLNRTKGCPTIQLANHSTRFFKLVLFVCIFVLYYYFYLNLSFGCVFDYFPDGEKAIMYIFSEDSYSEVIFIKKTRGRPHYNRLQIYFFLQLSDTYSLLSLSSSPLLITISFNLISLWRSYFGV